MTNKPMLSVERELLEDFAGYGGNGKVAEPYMVEKLREILDKTNSWACWGCKQSVSMRERADADGNCPHCAVELDIEDWPFPGKPATPVADTCPDKEDMLYDCAYRNGVMFGYGIGINGTEDDYQKCINRLQEQIAEARRVARRNVVKP